jgi:hypothetical protein
MQANLKRSPRLADLRGLTADAAEVSLALPSS